jgi:dihydroflavonol-4-reductase
MTVVVTGASGHVGANLVRALLAKSRPTRALVHTRRRALEELDIECIKGDICNLDSLLRAFQGADVVYHLAADVTILPNHWLSIESVNVVGTRNVVEACLECGVRRLVHFSSVQAVTCGSKDGIIDESCPLVDSPNMPPYDRSKAAGEREVLKGIDRGLDSIIIRPSAVVGPNDYRPSSFGEALIAFSRGRLPALAEGGFDWVDVRDVVKGAMAAEEKAPAGAKYLLSGHWVSLSRMVELAEKLTGIPAPRLVVPLWLARFGAPIFTNFDRLRGREPLFTSTSLRALGGPRNMSHDKATRELGYKPRPFEETFTDTISWFVAEGLITLLANISR